MPRSRTRLVPFAAAALAALGVAAPSALGATYTVNAGDDLQAALNAAGANPGADRIDIGPGTFTAPVAGGFTIPGNDALTIQGSGPSTVLRGTADGTEVLTTSGATVSDLAIELPAVSGNRGLVASRGEVHHVSITGGASGSSGVQLNGDAVAHHLTVAMPTGSAVYASSWLGASPTISDSSLAARYGVYANGNGLANPATTVRRTTIHAPMPVYANGAPVAVESSLLAKTAYAALGGATAACTANGSAALTLDHVTLVGLGVGLDASCSSAGKAATVSATNTAVQVDGAVLRRSADASSQADLSIAYASTSGGASSSTGPGATTLGAGVLTDTDPGFVDADAGDYRLAAGSPLIDAGDPAFAGGLTDLAGLPRLSGPRTDIGAHEVQQAPAGGGDAGGGAGGGGGASGGAGDGASTAAVPPAEPASPAGAPSAQPPAPPAAALDPARVRAALRAAIATGRRGTHAYVWPAAGEVRFTWHVGRRTIGRGAAERSAGTGARVRVRLTRAGSRALRRGAKVTVRATFTPKGGAPILVSASLPR